MFEPVRGGTRGGQAEFKWADVSQDKDREVCCLEPLASHICILRAHTRMGRTTLDTVSTRQPGDGRRTRTSTGIRVRDLRAMQSAERRLGESRRRRRRL